MTLHIHRAERADALVRGLGALLAAPPEDPFTPDVVAVPSKGVERWITQTLAARLGTSTGDGVCAGRGRRAPARRRVGQAFLSSGRVKRRQSRAPDAKAQRPSPR